MRPRRRERRESRSGSPSPARRKSVRGELAGAGISQVLLTPPNRNFDEVMELWGRKVIPACADAA